MFIVCYRTSILGLGASEEDAVLQACTLLKTLGEMETAQAYKKLRIHRLSQKAAKQYAKHNYVQLRYKNGMYEPV